MKKFIAAFLLATQVLLAASAFAEKRSIKVMVEPYVSTGGSHFSKKDPDDGVMIGKGGKWNSGGGVNIHLEKEDSNLKGKLYARMGFMTEPPDENRDHPSKDYEVGGEIIYNFNPGDKINILGNTGVAHKIVKRATNGDSDMSPDTRWNSLESLEAKAGIGLYGDLGHIMAEARYPLGINANKGANPRGDIGFKVELGTTLWENITIKFSYEEERYRELFNQKIPGHTKAKCQFTLGYLIDLF